jgi:hypothetical protein
LPNHRLATCVAAASAAVVLLTGCTVGDGSGSQSEGDGPDGTTAASGAGSTAGGPAPYLPVPEGVVLTDPGSELGLGEQATLAWRPEQGQVGVLNVKVRKLVRADIKELQNWQLDAAGRGSALYYVTMTVANVGDEDLSGRRLPLYVLDGANDLVEASAFKTDFEPCPSPALPEGFVTGEKVTVCQAYLVPKRGELRAVSFRPTQKFNPITWVGKVTESKKKPTKQPTEQSSESAG